MEYEKFIDRIKEAVWELCPDCEKIVVTKVLKNNSVELDGLAVVRKNESITPTVYLNDYYEKYLEGFDLLGLAKEIALISRERPFAANFAASKYYDFDYVRDKILYRLINTQRNSLILGKIPHRDFIDLSVVYYCCVSSGNGGEVAAVPIQNAHMKHWGVDENELYRLASDNIKRIFPTVIKKMSDFLDELFYGGTNGSDGFAAGLDEEDSAEETDSMDSRMYVVSNGKRIFGAAGMLDPEALRDFAKKNGAFYIIPSSVHEILFVPEYIGIDKEKLIEIVRDVNETQISFEEFLSDSLYRYEPDDSSIVKVDIIK